jgi:hypothetical protein
LLTLSCHLVNFLGRGAARHAVRSPNDKRGCLIKTLFESCSTNSTRVPSERGTLSFQSRTSCSAVRLAASPVIVAERRAKPKLCPGTYSQRRGPEVGFWEVRGWRSRSFFSTHSAAKLPKIQSPLALQISESTRSQDRYLDCPQTGVCGPVRPFALN